MHLQPAVFSFFKLWLCSIALLVTAAAALPVSADAGGLPVTPVLSAEPSVTPDGAFTDDPTVTPPATESPLPTATVACTPDGYEPDDTPAQAHRLVTDEMQTRSFCNPLTDDRDWVVVFLKRGRWELAARTTTGIYDPRLTMGALVADDTPDSKDAVLLVDIPADREHLVLVENVGVDGQGAYTLTLHKVGEYPDAPPDPTLPPAPGAEDLFEPDAPPLQPGYGGVQQRTFNPAGDVDFARYFLKAGLLTWFETGALTGGADTRLTVVRDDDGILTAEDPWLGGDDDSGEGLGSRLALQVDSDMWVTVILEQQGATWGPATGYTLRIVTAEQVTPTATSSPLPTVPAPPTVRPTYTLYPTYTPFPSPSVTPAATYTPYPTYTPAPREAVSGNAGYPAASRPAAPETAPVDPTPVAAGALRLEIFLDINGNGLMDRGEEVNDVLVHVTSRSRAWQGEVYTANGEAQLPLVGAPAGEALLVLVPYLHQSGIVEARGATIQSAIELQAPVYPAYLP